MGRAPALALLAALSLASSCSRAPESRLPKMQSIVVDGRDYESFDEAELGPCVTVDAGSDTEGTLAAARSFLKRANAHGSIGEAKDNLDHCAEIRTDDLALVGHGVSGAIYVGGGDHNIVEKTISSDNGDTWRPVMGQMTKGTGRLTLLSCNTGSGVRGADLLNLLHRATGRRVRALNALAYIDENRILLEKGAQWNEAGPDMTAVALPRPKPKNEPFAMPEVIELAHAMVRVSSIERVSIVGASMNIAEPFTIHRAQVPSIFRMIDLAHPFRAPGRPLSPETARIAIHSAEGRVHTLIVYGDVLARDAGDPAHFFDIAREATPTLEAWSRSGDVQ